MRKLTEGITARSSAVYRPWLDTPLNCPICLGTFSVEVKDFEGKEVGANFDAATWIAGVTYANRTVIAGPCPWCKTTIGFVSAEEEQDDRNG